MNTPPGPSPALAGATLAQDTFDKFRALIYEKTGIHMREGNHFMALSATILPELFRSPGRVRIWSAGCSTGEEVYTLRIVADQAARAAGVREPEIVGTDISTTVIGRAREGVYKDRALRLVPPELLKTCFVPADNGAFQVSATS